VPVDSLAGAQGRVQTVEGDAQGRASNNLIGTCIFERHAATLNIDVVDIDLHIFFDMHNDLYFYNCQRNSTST
jgi:hypothetical protein